MMIASSAAYPVARMMTVGPTAPVLAPAQPAVVAPPASPTVMTPASTNTVSASGIFSTIWSAITNFFSGVVNFFKNLFGGGTTPTATSTLSPADQALATQYQLLPTTANLAAFHNETSQYAANGTLGPGVNAPGPVSQLQAALNRLGYQVQPNGQYDQATAIAVQQFKTTTGMHQSYLAANGSPAINPCATPDVSGAIYAAVKQKMGIAG